MTKEQISELEHVLRKKIIFTLLVREFHRHRMQVPEADQLAFEIEEIDKLKCPTRMLKGYFNDVPEMREARGLRPAPANVDDIRWCVEKRYHRASGCKQAIWSDKLPYDEDVELCAIPEYKALVKEYKQIAYEKKQAMIAARPKEIPSQDIPVPKPKYDPNPVGINFDQGGVLSKSIKIQIEKLLKSL